MDHLPTVHKPRNLEHEVPLFCHDIFYDNKGISQFPQRHGFGLKRRIERIESSDCYLYHTSNGLEVNKQETCSILQAWLYFGMIFEVFAIWNIEVHYEDFIKKHEPDGNSTSAKPSEYLPTWKDHPDFFTKQDTESFITTSRLSQYIDKWIKAHQEMDQQTRREKTTETRNCLEEVATFAIGIPRLLYNNRDWRLTLSTIILGETLENALNTICDTSHLRNLPSLGIDRFQNPRIWSNSSQVSLVLPTMTYEARRWGCRTERFMIQAYFDTTTAFFASAIDRPPVPGISHEACSAKKCVAYQVNDKSYHTKHTSEECTCNFVAVDTDLTTSILKSGKIPRVKIKQSEGKIELEVVETGSYTAISHVWSDGLGNVQGNSLPTCQLRRLSDLLSASSKDDPNIAVWIDTFCVPVIDGPRKLALRLLHKTYAEAHSVLVLDGELQQSTTDCSLEEVLVRISLSGWMRRVWTMEEGILGRNNLVFKFSDGFIRLPREHKSVYHSVAGNTLTYLNQCLPARTSESHSQDIGRVIPSNQSDFMANLLTAIQYRNTSKEEDEFTCFASLLDLDVGSIVNIKDLEHRAQQVYLILSKLGYLMPSFFFFSEEPKLTTPGFRWAPISITSISIVDLDHIIRCFMARDPPRLFPFNTSGLYCRTLSYFLDLSSKSLRNEIYFWIEYPKGIKNAPTIEYAIQDYLVDGNILLTAEPTRPGSHVYPPVDLDQLPPWGPDWEKARHNTPKRLAVLICEDGFNRALVISIDDIKKDNSLQETVDFSAQGTEEVYYGSIIGRCNLIQGDPSMLDKPKAYNPERYNLAKATKAKSNTLWCIG